MQNPQNAVTILTVDVKAAVRNWRLLSHQPAKGCECAAAVKANAYGLGALRIVPALAWVGCRHFFVAHPFEGVDIRHALGRQNIYVLHGPTKGTEGDFIQHNLIPVLNTPEQVLLWKQAAKLRDKKLKAVIHVDTGMNRLGIRQRDFFRILDDPTALAGIEPVLLMSHLACAEQPDNPKNGEQLANFEIARKAFGAQFENVPCSLANSAGVFLGQNYHYQMVRPGISIYGGSPRPTAKNPMKPVVQLKAKIISLNEIEAGETVGYGATWKAGRKTKIATVAVGYADGWLTSNSNVAVGYMGDVPVPLVGRVSMDLVTFDVTDVPERMLRPGAAIDLIGKYNTIDEVAKKAGTIGYEILTSLGNRYVRTYVGEND